MVAFLEVSSRFVVFVVALLVYDPHFGGFLVFAEHIYSFAAVAVDMSVCLMWGEEDYLLLSLE